MSDQWNKAIPVAGAHGVGDDLADLDGLMRINNEAQDRMFFTYRRGARLYYASAATLYVGVGAVACANSGGTVVRYRRNTSVETVPFTADNPAASTNGLDTSSEGASKWYYAYAVADKDETGFSISLSLSASAPTGCTYYQLLGKFYNNSSSNIDSHSILNEDAMTDFKPYFGSWVSKTVTTIYQAVTDGLVVAGVTAGQLDGLTDSNASPSTVRAQTDGAGVVSIMFPVKKDDYWKVDQTGGSLFFLYWMPLQF